VSAALQFIVADTQTHLCYQPINSSSISSTRVAPLAAAVEQQQAGITRSSKQQ
jgi:hypothetical protein